MSDTVVICGAGPSAAYHRWEFDTPIMAISSGFDEAATFKHFVTMDRVICFPSWVVGGTEFDKHVPEGKFARYWQEHPNARVWKYDFDLQEPNFTNPGAPMARGPLPRNHSLLFGVQVAAAIGYRKMIFLGVDFTVPELYSINDAMRSWWPLAKDAGLEWLNASPLSMMQEWMPRCETEEWLVMA